MGRAAVSRPPPAVRAQVSAFPWGPTLPLLTVLPALQTQLKRHPVETRLGFPRLALRRVHLPPRGTLVALRLLPAGAQVGLTSPPSFREQRPLSRSAIVA